MPDGKLALHKSIASAQIPSLPRSNPDLINRFTAFREIGPTVSEEATRPFVEPWALSLHIMRKSTMSRFQKLKLLSISDARAISRWGHTAHEVQHISCWTQFQMRLYMQRGLSGFFVLHRSTCRLLWTTRALISSDKFDLLSQWLEYGHLTRHGG